MEMDARLTRAETAITTVDGRSGPASDVVQQLARLRSEARRHLSKVDTLRVGDLAALDEQIDLLREVAGDRLQAFGRDTPLSATLRSLHNDTGLKNLTAGLRIGLNQLRPDEVIDALPGQKTAAFQFAFEGDRLRAVDQPFRSGEREMALAALEAAVEQGRHINEDLSTTNTSPRLKDAFSRLQETMSSYKNIVQIGARTQMCSRLVQADSDELSASLFGMLVGHVENVYSALAQFQEWREYCENAASIGLNSENVSDLAKSTSALVEQMRLEPATDVSVTDALETVAGWVEGEVKPDQRDVLSLARTLENLWSVVVKSTLAVGREAVSEARKAAAKVVLVALLAAGAAAVPVISKVPGGEWIQTVYNYFKSVGTDAAKK